MILGLFNASHSSSQPELRSDHSLDYRLGHGSASYASSRVRLRPGPKNQGRKAENRPAWMQGSPKRSTILPMTATAQRRDTKARRSPDLRPEPLRTLILIPAHNEAENIPGLLDDLLRRHDAEDVLLIDDGSADESGALARARGCKVLRHHFNLGYGASLLSGYHYALIRGYEAVIQMDADGQHPPRALPELMAPIQAGDADHVLGSRFLEGHAEGTTFLRKLASRMLTGLARFWTGKQFSDPTSGFQAMRREVVEALCNDGFPEDFPDLDVLMDLHRRGFRLVEVSTPMRDREHGQSMHGGLHVLYYFYRLGMNIMLLPVRRPSLYCQDRLKVGT